MKVPGWSLICVKSASGGGDTMAQADLDPRHLTGKVQMTRINRNAAHAVASHRPTRR